MDDGDFTVDLGELEDVIGFLERCERALEQLTEDVETSVARLHETWSGLTAVAQQEAHEEWEQGMREMRTALAEMRQAAEIARRNYTQAVTANTALWRGLA